MPEFAIGAVFQPETREGRNSEVSQIPSTDYDVAVVGAGPAGATAALYLARGGKKVALIERETLPRYKTCGGGVVGRAFQCLPSDVRIPVEHECFVAEANFLESKMSFRVERKVPIVSMTMRAELDKALTDAAVASGADTVEEVGSRCGAGIRCGAS
jgi:flavin-dependent dehydrogenase